MFAGGLTGDVLFRWSSTTRFQSTDTFTDDVDPKETQRLKDEETVYETQIRHTILDAALGYVDISGWSKQALAEAVSQEPGVVIGPVTDRLMRFRPIGWYGVLGWSRYREDALYRIETGSSIAAL